MKNKISMGLLMGALAAVTVISASYREADTEASVVDKEFDSSFTTDEQGRSVYQPHENAHDNAMLLQAFLDSDEEKTLVIPSGSTVEIEFVVDIGSNTTIIAEGATIVQTVDGKGVIAPAVDGGNYDAIENVKIVGGTWKNKENSQAASMMRFAHGKNLTFDGVEIETNFQGHGLELIACRDVVVDNCTIEAKNSATKEKLSKEDALQIDLATPKTAPGILREGGSQSYVNGQVCQNITVKDSTISGSRGVCANASTQEKKFLDKFHKNITITGCTITGESTEGLSLLNTYGCKVRNNVIKSNGSSNDAYSDGVHFTLLGKAKQAGKYKNEFTGNKVYGKFYGMDITSSNVKYPHGTVVVKNNTLYSKKGKKNALHIVRCKKMIVKKNKLKKW